MAGMQTRAADVAKIAFAHLHLAGRALDWIYDKGVTKLEVVTGVGVQVEVGVLMSSTVPGTGTNLK